VELENAEKIEKLFEYYLNCFSADFLLNINILYNVI